MSKNSELNWVLNKSFKWHFSSWTLRLSLILELQHWSWTLTFDPELNCLAQGSNWKLKLKTPVQRSSFMLKLEPWDWALASNLIFELEFYIWIALLKLFTEKARPKECCYFPESTKKLTSFIVQKLKRKLPEKQHIFTKLHPWRGWQNCPVLQKWRLKLFVICKNWTSRQKTVFKSNYV